MGRIFVDGKLLPQIAAIKAVMMNSVGAAIVATGRPADAQSGNAGRPRGSAPWIEARDDAKLFYRDWGEGRPVMFCPPGR